MPTIQKDNQAQPIPAGSFGPEDIAIAYLIERFRSLSKEALEDLSELAPAVAECDDPETFMEIMETMREILFPELIGDVQAGTPSLHGGVEGLKKRMDWIGEKIREKRKTADMTQEQLAEKSGLPQSHISRLEKGQHSPSHKTLNKIAKALGCSIGELDPATD